MEMYGRHRAICKKLFSRNNTRHQHKDELHLNLHMTQRLLSACLMEMSHFLRTNISKNKAMVTDFIDSLRTIVKEQDTTFDAV